MVTYLNTFYRDESGAAAIEYTLVVALISITLIGMLDNIGDKVRGILFQIFTNLHAVEDGTPAWYTVGVNFLQYNTNGSDGSGDTKVTPGDGAGVGGPNKYGSRVNSSITGFAAPSLNQ